jgi:hypothetical protein
MTDITIWVLVAFFAILGLIIILGAIKGCYDLIQTEREMKIHMDNRIKGFVSEFKETNISFTDISNQDPV